jgi:hypothetical protein
MQYVKKIFYKACFLSILLMVGMHVHSQVTISGPTCVVAGTVYQYDISGKWDSASVMQVCLSGGAISDSSGNSNTCTQQGSPVTKVTVVWNDSAADIGALSIASSLGSATFNVHFTDPLLPGAIDSAVKTQYIVMDSMPGIITCLPDSGGSCTPSYSYQWQQSSNGISWTEISGATQSSLVISTPMTLTTYYRKKVTEINSGTIGYSDIATVFVSGSTGFNIHELRENEGLAFNTKVNNIKFF